MAQRKPQFPIHAFDAFMVVSPAFPAKHHVHAGRTIMHPHFRDLLDAHLQRALIPRDRFVTVDRAGQLQQCAGLPLARAETLHQVRDQITAPGRLQSFFDSTSCSMALSSDRSATSRLSFAFSSSSCFSRRSSEGDSPPYFVRQL